MSDAKPPAKKPAAKTPAAKTPAAKAPAPAPAPAPAAAPPAPTYADAPAQPPYPTVVPLRPEEERNVAMLSHLISLLAILLSASWVSALIFYLIYKDRGPFVRQHTATELNFQLTMVVAAIAGFILTLIFIGILVWIAIPILMIVFGIIATIRANQGQPYTYPIAIRFVH